MASPATVDENTQTHQKVVMFFWITLVAITAAIVLGGLLDVLANRNRGPLSVTAIVYAIPPFSLLLAVYGTLMLVSLRESGGVFRTVTMLTTLTAAGALVFDFVVLHDMAFGIGVNEPSSVLFATVVTGVLVVCSLSLVVLYRSEARDRTDGLEMLDAEDREHVRYFQRLREEGALSHEAQHWRDTHDAHDGQDGYDVADADDAGDPKLDLTDVTDVTETRPVPEDARSR